MEEHHVSLLINSMLGRLFLGNQAFQSLPFKSRQSIIADLVDEAYNSDYGNLYLREILSNTCFFKYQKIDEGRTLSHIFKICSSCREKKKIVEDYRVISPQGFCSDCANRLFSKKELKTKKITYKKSKKGETYRQYKQHLLAEEKKKKLERKKMEQIEEQIEKKRKKDSILLVLYARFDRVPKEIKTQIKKISSIQKLTSILYHALEIDSLDDLKLN